MLALSLNYLIDLNSLDDDCTIDFSILGIGVKRTRGISHPPVESTTKVVVKFEPITSRAPSSPTMWGDFISPDDVNHAHDLYLKKLGVYTPWKSIQVAVDIPSISSGHYAEAP